MEQSRRQHILVVTYPAQGHINPAIHLATRLAATTGARITFSTSVSAHRKMFPDLASPDREIDSDDGAVTYLPFSDGYDNGFDKDTDKVTDFLHKFKTVGSRNLSCVIDVLASRGRPVDCVVYTFMVSWAAEVAGGHGILSAQYWIQPATVFAIYHHSFHGYDALIAAHSGNPLSAVELPGLPPLQIRDLPSFLTTLGPADDPYSLIGNSVREAFLILDRERERSERKKPKVLVNTFEQLEEEAFAAVDDGLDLIAVGPILQSFPDAKAGSGFHLFKQPDEKAYMEWLDSKTEKSVVYVSFGSLAVLKDEQMGEILKGLKASGRPYLWVVRKDCRSDAVELVEDNGDDAMVVEWCSQVRVLTHRSIGCFVTHCGWNSTLESLVFGVPTVGVPQWTDQGTNAMLLEKAWGTGIRGEVDEDGVLKGEELKRCLDLVMGGGERGAEIWRRAEIWKVMAVEAVSEGGSSHRNLKTFVGQITK